MQMDAADLERLRITALTFHTPLQLDGGKPTPMFNKPGKNLQIDFGRRVNDHLKDFEVYADRMVGMLTAANVGEPRKPGGWGELVVENATVAWVGGLASFLTAKCLRKNMLVSLSKDGMLHLDLVRQYARRADQSEEVHRSHYDRLPPVVSFMGVVCHRRDP